MVRRGTMKLQAEGFFFQFGFEWEEAMIVNI